MSYAWETELPALVGLSDQEVANVVNSMMVDVPREFRVTYRTILQVIRDPARLEAVRAHIKETLITLDEMLSEYSDAGGVDVQYPESKAFLQSMIGEEANQLRQSEADSIIALGYQKVPKYALCAANQVFEVRSKT